MSLDYEEIEKEALQNAKELIIKRFTTVSSLHEVSLVSSEYRQTLFLSKLHLQRAIQANDDDFSLLRQKIGILFHLTSSFKQRFSSITTHGNNSHPATYSKSPYWIKILSRLSYAQTNILTTLKRIDEFALLPRKVEHLQNLMNACCNDYSIEKERIMLKYVAGHTLQLEHWRDNIILDILHLDQEHQHEQEYNKRQLEKVSENTADKRAHMLITNRRSQYFHNAVRNFCSKRKSLYEYDHIQVIQFIGKHLDRILHLSKEFRGIIKRIISNCLTIGQQNPDLLTQAADVTCLIVQNKITEDYLLLEEEKGETLHEKNEKLTFQQEIENILQDVLDRDIQTKFCDYIFQAADKEKSKFDATLEAASYGLADYIVFMKEISSCFPNDFGVESMYHIRFHRYIIPQVQALYYQIAVTKGEQQLRVCDISNLLSWIDHYQQSIVLGKSSNTTATSSTHIMSFTKDIDVLKGLCVTVTRNQIREMFDAIRTRNSELTFDQEGLITTNDPEDIFSVINMELSVLNAHMPIHIFSSFILICVEELKVLQENMRTDIDEGIKSNEIECHCSIINDCSKLYDRCEIFCDDYTNITAETCSNDENVFQDKANIVLVGYISLSLHVLDKITDSILSELRNRHVIERIFTADWGKGEPIVGTVIKTLQDYFNDLKVWLPEYYFSKCVRQCFEKVVTSYTDEVLCSKAKNNTLEFHDMLRISQVIINDKMELIDFFGDKMLPHLTAAGFKGKAQLEECLEFMNSVSRILGSVSMEDVSKSIIHLLTQFGSKNSISFVRKILCKRKDFDENDMTSYEQIMIGYEIRTNNSTYSTLTALRIKNQNGQTSSNNKEASNEYDKNKYIIYTQSPRMRYSNMKEKTWRIGAQAKAMIKTKTKPIHIPVTLPRMNSLSIKTRVKKKLSST